MPLDPATLDTDTPRTLDGRSYPDDLRPYEQYDAVLFPLVIELERFEPTELVVLAVSEGNDRFAVSKWLQSASWRGLVEHATNP